MDKFQPALPVPQGVPDGQLPGLNVSELRAGAAARAAGATYFDNPWRRHGAMWDAVSEPHSVWKARALSWELGWGLENMARYEATRASALATIDVLEHHLASGPIWPRGAASVLPDRDPPRN